MLRRANDLNTLCIWIPQRKVVRSRIRRVWKLSQMFKGFVNWVLVSAFLHLLFESRERERKSLECSLLRKFHFDSIQLNSGLALEITKFNAFSVSCFFAFFSHSPHLYFRHSNHFHPHFHRILHSFSITAHTRNAYCVASSNETST